MSTFADKDTSKLIYEREFPLNVYWVSFVVSILRTRLLYVMVIVGILTEP